MMLIWMRLLGFKIHEESGRADAVWEQPGLTVIADTGRVILLGIAFSGKDVGCRMEELGRSF